MRLALTFDAEHPDMPGSDAAVIEQILSELRQAEISATFFIQGRWASAFPELARAIAKEGHLIGSHSHYHADMRLLSRSGIAADLQRARDAIKAATRVDPAPHFRFPFSFGINDHDAARAVLNAGYRHYFWDVDSLDWQGASGRQIFKRVSKAARPRRETVALFHTWPAATAEGIKRIIEWGHEKNARFVTVDQLREDHSGFPSGLMGSNTPSAIREIA